MTDKASKKGSTSKQTKSTKSSKSAKAAPKKPNAFQRFFAYLKNVRQEINRTSWPSRAEVMRMSAIVIGALLFFGIIIFGLDSIMTRFVAFYAKLSQYAKVVEPESLSDVLDHVLSGLSSSIL